MSVGHGGIWNGQQPRLFCLGRIEPNQNHPHDHLSHLVAQNREQSFATGIVASEVPSMKDPNTVARDQEHVVVKTGQATSSGAIHKSPTGSGIPG